MQTSCTYDCTPRFVRPCVLTPSRSTGKERDAETGLDFFGARYYASTVGRWMSPDWAQKPEAVPYSSLGDPQSLNLYNYVGNNPLSKADADGHDGESYVIGGLISWAAHGIATQGAKGFAKNVGIGIAKGLGSAVVNTVRMAAAGTNPGAIAASMTAPTPKKLQPSNRTQAQASLVTQIVAPAVAGAALGAVAGAAGGAEGVTAEGTTYFHYGYAENESMFAGGLNANSYATTTGDLTGAEAQSTLALPNRISGPPNAVYPVTPEAGTPINGPSTVQPANGYPGGGQEVNFPQGTGPGTVGAPRPIPPQ